MELKMLYLLKEHVICNAQASLLCNFRRKRELQVLKIHFKTEICLGCPFELLHVITQFISLFYVLFYDTEHRIQIYILGSLQYYLKKKIQNFSDYLKFFYLIKIIFFSISLQDILMLKFKYYL